MQAWAWRSDTAGPWSNRVDAEVFSQRRASWLSLACAWMSSVRKVVEAWLVQLSEGRTLLFYHGKPAQARWLECFPTHVFDGLNKKILAHWTCKYNELDFPLLKIQIVCVCVWVCTHTKAPAVAMSSYSDMEPPMCKFGSKSYWTWTDHLTATLLFPYL